MFSFFFKCFSLKKTRKNPKNEKTHEQHEQKTCLFFDGGNAGIAQNLEKPNFPSRNVHVFFTRFHFFPVSCRSSLLWFRTVEGKLWIRAEHGHRFEVSYDWLLSYDASTCLNIMERSQI